jgi:LAO/AO transport system ATPase
MNRPQRVLIAKIGLDGHDRGAKLIVRNLRDAGMEVIYSGLWQTPGATVHAALQEDVDVLGVSLLSAAHMTIMPELRRLCNDEGIGDLPIIVGGIIPEGDQQPLRDTRSVDGIFTPGTPMQTIIETIRALAERRTKLRDSDDSKIDIQTGRGLARAVTYLVHGHGERVGPLPKPARKPVRIGITGAPGVGKSTFIGKLAAGLRERDHRVAVIAVDPTSPITGGSVLGDRLRIQSDRPDHDMFIRSLASEGQAGGLAPHCADIGDLLAAAGYEIIIIETVGAGQNDTQVRDLTDEVLLLVMPGAGDAIQFAKAGVFEIASGYVVHKADLDGADRTARQIREALTDNRPIWSVSSVRGEGIDPLCGWLETKLGG